MAARSPHLTINITVLQATCAYCLLHNAAADEHILLSSYGVALDWQQLRHLVLKRRAAEDAMLAAGAYLHVHAKPGREVFSLSGGGRATMDFALAFAQ